MLPFRLFLYALFFSACVFAQCPSEVSAEADGFRLPAEAWRASEHRGLGMLGPTIARLFAEAEFGMGLRVWIFASPLGRHAVAVGEASERDVLLRKILELNPSAEFKEEAQFSIFFSRNNAGGITQLRFRRSPLASEELARLLRETVYLNLQGRLAADARLSIQP